MYPKNKTQLIKFLREHPGIHFKITQRDGITQMRKLKRAQTNAFSSIRPDGKEIWFYYEQGDTYSFNESVFTVTAQNICLVFDFKPSVMEIQAYESECQEAAA